MMIYFAIGMETQKQKHHKISRKCLELSWNISNELSKSLSGIEELRRIIFEELRN